MERSNSDFFVNRFGTVFWIVLAGMLLPLRMFATFGLSDEGKVFVAGSGAGLVFKVDKANGNIVSIRYKGGAELHDGNKGSHIASGFGDATVAGAVTGGDTRYEHGVRRPGEPPHDCHRAATLIRP